MCPVTTSVTASRILKSDTHAPPPKKNTLYLLNGIVPHKSVK